MIRRPPRSTRTDTLFPYTTLFRSGVGRRLHPCLILGDIMQFGLTDDQTAIQEMARRFTADAITPHAAEWDEKHIFPRATRSEEHTSELQSLLRLSYAVLCLNKKRTIITPRYKDRQLAETYTT